MTGRRRFRTPPGSVPGRRLRGARCKLVRVGGQQPQKNRLVTDFSFVICPDCPYYPNHPSESLGLGRPTA